MVEGGLEPPRSVEGGLEPPRSVEGRLIYSNKMLKYPNRAVKTLHKKVFLQVVLK